MKLKRLLAGFVLVAGAVSQDRSQQRYVGKSKCLPELKAATEHYGIRLDKSQEAYLAAYRLKDGNILTIIQSTGENDQCGVIKDVVQSRDSESSFVWECRNRAAPSNVVVGTWPAKHPRVSGPASEAWRIDLKLLKFVPLQGGTVTCRAGDYAGSDKGDDLVSWVKRRASRRRAPLSK
jgi:hypothetical protein